MTIKIEFSEEEKKGISYERYHHPHPRVQRKMEAVWLKSQGLPHREICRLTGVSKGTLGKYLKAYQEGGIEALKEIKFYKPQSELVGHTETIEAYFGEHPPATIKEAMAKIEELTGLKRSEPQVRHFLKSIGLKRRKIGMLPAKADPQAQAVFKAEKLDPILAEAKAGTRKVFFC